MNSLIRSLTKITLTTAGLTLLAYGTVLTVTGPPEPPHLHDPDDPLPYY